MKRKDEDDNIDHNNKKKKKEDQKLTDTIKTHGEGKKQHCGKMSCRMRWMKHLRRRHFSEAEEDLIIKLHALLGDRWSLIAGRFPGRTDYEIENYWNSHMKEKLKSAGIDPNNHRVDQTLITTSSTATATENPNTYEDTKSFISRKEPSRNLFEPRSSTRNGDEEEQEVAGFSSTELNLDLTIAFRPSSSSSSPSCFLRLEKKKKQLEENNDTQNQQEQPTLLLFK